MSWLRNLRDGRHFHLSFDEVLGWTVVRRGIALDGVEALSSTVPRVRRLAKVAARRNPNQGLTSEGETFIRPQRSSEHPG